MDENDYFWRIVNTPLYWQDAARELICAANLLKKNHNEGNPWAAFADEATKATILTSRNTTMRPVIVLYAVAVENMVKAIIVAMGKDPIEQTKDGKHRIASWFANHDLNELIKHTDVQGLDKELLDHLFQVITSGKYPTGKFDGPGLPYGAALRGAESILPVLEEHLAQIESKRDKLEKTDLLNLCIESNCP